MVTSRAPSSPDVDLDALHPEVDVELALDDGGGVGRVTVWTSASSGCSDSTCRPSAGPLPGRLSSTSPLRVRPRC
jgi:hypothetical protein